VEEEAEAEAGEEGRATTDDDDSGLWNSSMSSSKPPPLFDRGSAREPVSGK
jgi:hypothetical protein